MVDSESSPEQSHSLDVFHLENSNDSELGESLETVWILPDALLEFSYSRFGLVAVPYRFKYEAKVCVC